ncbi:MAG: hypothetical protein KDB90_07835 [Planctomycetes bacterium]|nr:hypothetical protein [Planctomycetota bacterium]
MPMRIRVVYIVLLHACVGMLFGLGIAGLEKNHSGTALMSLTVIGCALGLLVYGVHQLLYSVKVDKQGVVVRGFGSFSIPWGDVAGWRELPDAGADESRQLIDHDGRVVLTLGRHLYNWDDGFRWVRLTLAKLDPANQPPANPVWRGRASLWNAAALNISMWLGLAWLFSAGWQWCRALTAVALATLVAGGVMIAFSAGRVGIARHRGRPGIRLGLTTLALALMLQPLGPYIVTGGHIGVANMSVGLVFALFMMALTKSVRWKLPGAGLTLGLFLLLGIATFANMNTALCGPSPRELVVKARYFGNPGKPWASTYSRGFGSSMGGDKFVVARLTQTQNGGLVRLYEGESIFGYTWQRMEPIGLEEFD